MYQNGLEWFECTVFWLINLFRGVSFSCGIMFFITCLCLFIRLQLRCCCLVLSTFCTLCMTRSYFFVSLASAPKFCLSVYICTIGHGIMVPHILHNFVSGICWFRGLLFCRWRILPFIFRLRFRLLFRHPIRFVVIPLPSVCTVFFVLVYPNWFILHSSVTVTSWNKA